MISTILDKRSASIPNTVKQYNAGIRKLASEVIPGQLELSSKKNRKTIT